MQPSTPTQQETELYNSYEAAKNDFLTLANTLETLAGQAQNLLESMPHDSPNLGMVQLIRGICDDANTQLGPIVGPMKLLQVPAPK